MCTAKAIKLIAIYILFAFNLSQSANATVSVCATPPISPTPILPFTSIKALGCLPNLNFGGSRDEVISGTFTIQSTEPLRNLAFKAGPLTSQSSLIPASAIDIRYVKTWYLAGTAWVSIRQDKMHKLLVPDLLLHNPDFVAVDENQKKNFLVTTTGNKLDITNPTSNSTTEIIPIDRYSIQDSDTTLPINLNANTNQQIWLTIHIPTSSQPGEYQGKVSVTSNEGNLHLEVPFNLTVYPFYLSEPDILYSIYYRGILTPDNQGSISSENKSIDQMTAELKNLKDHGIRNPTIYQPPEPISLFNTVLNLREAAGLDNSTLYYLGIKTDIPLSSPNFEKSISSLKKISSMAAKHKTNKILIYGIDEADSSLIPLQIPRWNRYKNAGAEIFAADWRPGSQHNYGGLISTLILGSEIDGAPNQFLHSKGSLSFLYNQPQVGVKNPYIYRLHYGISAWSKGYDGVMDYAYQHSMGDIWDDFDHPDFRDHVFAYPTRNGVIDTVAWEGFREAIIDVRYLSTLKKLAELYNSEDDLNYLARIKSTGVIDLDKMRREIADRIISLCDTKRSGNPSPICLLPPSPVTNLQISQ